MIKASAPVALYPPRLICLITNKLARTNSNETYAVKASFPKYKKEKSC